MTLAVAVKEREPLRPLLAEANSAISIGDVSHANEMLKEIWKKYKNDPSAFSDPALARQVKIIECQIAAVSGDSLLAFEKGKNLIAADRSTTPFVVWALSEALTNQPSYPSELFKAAGSDKDRLALIAAAMMKTAVNPASTDKFIHRVTRFDALQSLRGDSQYSSLEKIWSAGEAAVYQRDPEKALRLLKDGIASISSLPLELRKEARNFAVLMMQRSAAQLGTHKVDALLEELLKVAPAKDPIRIAVLETQLIYGTASFESGTAKDRIALLAREILPGGDSQKTEQQLTQQIKNIRDQNSKEGSISACVGVYWAVIGIGGALAGVIKARAVGGPPGLPPGVKDLPGQIAREDPSEFTGARRPIFGGNLVRIGTSPEGHPIFAPASSTAQPAALVPASGSMAPTIMPPRPTMRGSGTPQPHVTVPPPPSSAPRVYDGHNLREVSNAKPPPPLADLMTSGALKLGQHQIYPYPHVVHGGTFNIGRPSDSLANVVNGKQRVERLTGEQQDPRYLLLDDVEGTDAQHASLKINWQKGKINFTLKNGEHKRVTAVNGEKLQPGEEREVAQGDWLRLGNQIYSVRGDGLQLISDNANEMAKLWSGVIRGPNHNLVVNQGTQDCYFAASLQSLAKHPDGWSTITSMIRSVGGGTYKVVFPGYPDAPQLVTQQDINNFLSMAKGGQDANFHGTTLLETAYSKLREQLGQNDRSEPMAIDLGYPDEAMFALTGKSRFIFFPGNGNDSLASSSYHKAQLPKVLDRIGYVPECGILTAQTTKTLPVGLQDKWLPSHVYAIMRVDPRRKVVYLADPNNGRTEKAVTYEEFGKIFNYIGGIQSPTDHHVFGPVELPR